MGEAKNRRDRMSDIERTALSISRRMANDGKLIQGGWAAYCTIHNLRADAPDYNVRMLAYFSGAEHLWSSVLAILDEDREPTDRDLKRMALIQKEIDGLRDLLHLDLHDPEGSA